MATWLLNRNGQSAGVITLLSVQALLLAFSATRHSPTHLEPAFLASGISHWQFSRFELYRVNPPLVRMVAAIPAQVIGSKTSWVGAVDGPGARGEYSTGEAFFKANGAATVSLVQYARWACIPFSLIGAYFAYRWSKDLYGDGAGLATLVLYVFDPNLLAHGELITPDAACTAFGILAGYTFWRWLKSPSWLRALVAGGALGLAELTKLSWLILLGLWPILWLVWLWLGRVPRNSEQEPEVSRIPGMAGLLVIFSLAIYTINLGYGFDGFGRRLDEFAFVSKLLTGLDQPGIEGNRFRSSWCGQLPVPLPKQYLLGLDSQMKDLESYHLRSYLRGEWKEGGWWYYYLYGLLVKEPCGTWGLFALVVGLRLMRSERPVPLRDELVLLVPAVLLLAIASSQTVFNIHLRYVFPALGLCLIFLGQAVSPLAGYTRATRSIALVFISYSVISCISVYPHHLAYFNDFVGGPKNGFRHLLGSSLDWGQDLLFLRDYLHRNQITACDFRLDQLTEDAAKLVMPEVQPVSLKECRITVASPNRLGNGIESLDGFRMVTPTLWIKGDGESVPGKSNVPLK